LAHLQSLWHVPAAFAQHAFGQSLGHFPVAFGQSFGHVPAAFAQHDFGQSFGHVLVASGRSALDFVCVALPLFCEQPNGAVDSATAQMSPRVKLARHPIQERFISLSPC
jgi:hypothetical protein